MLYVSPAFVEYALARLQERSTVLHLVTLGVGLFGLNIGAGTVQDIAVAICALAQIAGAVTPDGPAIPTLPDVPIPAPIPPRPSITETLNK